MLLYEKRYRILGLLIAYFHTIFIIQIQKGVIAYTL